MYHTRLRASGDGTILTSTTTARTAPVEGEALITTNYLSPAEQAAGAELDETTVLRNLDPTLPVADAMQTVRPVTAECPPCPPPQVIYRDRVVEKTVRGPTQYVYLPGPAPAGSPLPSYRLPPGRVEEDAYGAVALPYGADSAAGLPGGGAAVVSPEQAAASAGSRFPWLLLLAAAGAAYWYTRKER